MLNTDAQIGINTKKIDKIELVVFGNGDEGLAEIVRATLRKLEEHIVVREKEEAKREKVQFVFLSAVVGNGFLLLGFIIAFFLQIYPILLRIESDTLVVLK